MDLQPLYLPGKAMPAYQLRFSWTGWPETRGLLPDISSQLFEQLSGLWKSDGLNLLEYLATEERVQLLFSTKPGVAPTFLAARAKGRLDHALRQAGLATMFSRKVSVQRIGENTNTDVQNYIQQQIVNESFVDQKFADSITPFTQTFADVDTSQPIQATRGRYWYNLHIV